MTQAGSIQTPSIGDIVNAASRVLLGWDPAMRQRARKLAKRYLVLLKGLGSAHQAGDQDRSRARLERLVSSRAARFCAYVLGYPDDGPRLSMAALLDEIDKVNPRHPSGEPIRVIMRPKPEGGFRPISMYGPRGRAAQRLLRDALVAMLGHSPHEYARKGRGRDAAIREVIQSHRNGGVRWFAETDIKKFFPSVNGEALSKLLPLPKSMIENTLLTPTETKIVSLSIGHPYFDEISVRAGLPMGSLVSPFIASKLLEPVLAGVKAPMVTCHGDNILVGGKTKDEVVLVMNALAAALMQHPAGPFQPTGGEPIKVGSKINHLGYTFARRLQAYGGWIVAKPSAKSIRRFQRKLACKLVETPPDQHSMVIEAACTGWARSFGVWGGREHGISIAVVEFCNWVMPLVTAFLKEAGTFASPKAARAEFEANWLPVLDLLPKAKSIKGPILKDIGVATG